MLNIILSVKKYKLCAILLFALLFCFSAHPCQAAVIALNAGHQEYACLEKEPLGPNSKISKSKAARGTRGIISGLPEYELNLQNALLLEQELLSRGHKVVMIRRTNAVNISNKERVEYALAHGAEIIINLHANAPGARQPKDMHGIMTLCRSKNNSFNAELYPSERALAEKIQQKLCAATGAKNLGVVETDRMTGINWSSVPSVIVEVGYMTNEKEEAKLLDEAYRKTIARAIADAVAEWLKSAVNSSLE